MGNDAAISVAGGDKHKRIMQQGHATNGSTTVNSVRMCTGERCIDHEEGFASQFYSMCLRGFQQLCRQVQEGYASGARSYLLKEELGKLYLWGESFSPGELDKALDEYEEIRDNVLDLLVNLGELIIRALRASSTVAHAGLIHEIESSIERARFIASDVDGQEDVDVLPGDTNCLARDDYSDDDMADFCEDVAFTIKCLTELGPSLQQNLASAGRRAPPVSESTFSLPCPSGPAGFYVSLVRDKFKRASKGLIERLGEANWQRHVRVRNKMKDLENNPAKGQDTSRSTFRDSAIGTSIPAWTQYAPSHTSFRTSNPEGGPRSLRVPPAPLEAADGKPFQCYLCGDMLSTVRTRTQWKMHVFSDLMPYLCTFDGCQHKLKSFQSRSSWADHEFQEHRLNRYWACPECSRKSCSTLEWEHHLDDVHNLKFSAPDLVAARKNACHISPKRAEEEQCPLCQVIPGNSRRAFVKHVSQHMEDIALMALPSNAEEDSETGSVHTDHASVKENDASKDGFGDDNGNTVYSERYDRGGGLVSGSPEVEQPFVLHSGSPADSPPRARFPNFERISEEPLSQESDESAKEDSTSPKDNQAGEEPFSEENDESADGNLGGSETGPDAFDWLFAGASHSKSDSSPREYRAGGEPFVVKGDGARDVDLLNTHNAREFRSLLTSSRENHQYPVDNKSPQAPHLETPTRVDSFMQQPDLSIDGKLQVLSPQEPVHGKRVNRFTPKQWAQISMKRITGACPDCRRAKRRCTHSLPRDSMNRGNHTEPPPSLTSSPVLTNDPLAYSPQPTKPPWESIGEQTTKPIEVDPSQVMLDIHDRHDHLPPVPLFPPANTKPPSDTDLDQGKSPQPVNEVGKPSGLPSVAVHDFGTWFEPKAKGELSAEDTPASAEVIQLAKTPDSIVRSAMREIIRSEPPASSDSIE